MPGLTGARRPSAPAAGFLTAIVAASLFAWLGPLSRWAYDAGMEPLPFVAWRAGIAAVVLLVPVALLARRGRRVFARSEMSRGEIVGLGVAIVTGIALNLAIFGAFERVSVAIALIGFYMYPAGIAAVAILLGHERLTPAVLVALVLALAGMAIVVLGSLDPAAGVVADPVGILLALGAAAAQTVFVTISHRYARIPAEQAMGSILAGTLVGCVVIGVAVGLGPELLEPVRTPAILPIVLAAGATGAAIPSLLFLTSIRLIGGTRAGILMLLEPVVGVALAAILLGERLQPVQALGAAAVLAAALLLQRSRRPAAGDPETGVISAHEAVPGAPPTG